ncbi:diguanylate cyclase [Thiomicrorhabdus aquaedulcis]|uniref:transporter substrate-binding domain-containing diguanylate cyclase n=1 Tax=Thiomicrorhabdus aquaedulcis TaxID=2211106 RepID=UPI000FD7F8EE|nr:diguanylate cyclase [Thiomicrorhabdus aquaedulcis]
MFKSIFSSLLKALPGLLILIPALLWVSPSLAVPTPIVEKPNSTSELESVSLQLKWTHQFQFAGYYAALKKGFYREEGLDVTIKPREPFKNNIQQVIDGESHYGIADSILLLYQARKAPVVIIAPIFQHSPQVFITLKSSGIDSLYDLNSRAIAFYEKDTDGFGLLAMLRQNNVQPDLSRMMIKGLPDSLLLNKIQAYPSYLSNEPYWFKQQGIDINIINPMHYGLDFYGDMLFTTQTELNQHPERVERFKRATLKGWDYALKHKKELINYIKDDLKSDKTFDHLLFEANVLEEMIQPHSTPIGSLNPGRLEFMQKTLLAHNLIDSAFELNSGIYQPENHTLHLSHDEKQWIQDHPVIKVAIDPHWAPLEFVNDNGQHSGVASAYLAHITAMTGLKFVADTESTWSDAVRKVKFRELDMFSAVLPTSERQNYVQFTQAYLSAPTVIATQQGVDYIDKMSKLEGKVITVVENYAIHETLHNNYPNLTLNLVQSPTEGLEAVSQGKAFAYIDHVAVITHYLNSMNVRNVQINGETPIKSDVAMAIRKDWPELHSIIQKALNTLDTATHQHLTQRWINTQEPPKINWQWIVIILSPLLVLVVFGGLYLFKLRRLNTQLSQSNLTLKETKEQLQASNLRLEALSATDFLTGIANRKQLEHMLEYEHVKAQRYHQSVCLLMIDLDYFKNVNDHYGHQVGDEVLKKVTAWIEKQVRKSDTFGRWGGEEFMLICPSTLHESAQLLAEKIRYGVSQLEFSQPIVQTLSIGVACYKTDENLPDWIKRADERLYHAKHMGRNQVVAH